MVIVKKEIPQQILVADSLSEVQAFAALVRNLIVVSDVVNDLDLSIVVFVCHCGKQRCTSVP
jgi:hypothetical protein